MPTRSWGRQSPVSHPVYFPTSSPGSPPFLGVLKQPPKPPCAESGCMSALDCNRRVHNEALTCWRVFPPRDRRFATARASASQRSASARKKGSVVAHELAAWEHGPKWVFHESAWRTPVPRAAPPCMSGAWVAQAVAGGMAAYLGRFSRLHAVHSSA